LGGPEEKYGLGRRSKKRQIIKGRVRKDRRATPWSENSSPGQIKAGREVNKAQFTLVTETDMAGEYKMAMGCQMSS